MFEANDRFRDEAFAARDKALIVAFDALNSKMVTENGVRDELSRQTATFISRGASELFYCYFSDSSCIDKMRLSSSFHHISVGDPPSLVVIGSLDMTPNGLADHAAYHGALLAAGVDSELLIMGGYGHGELWPDVAPTLLDFFVKHLGSQ